jgi:hypothetical protein|tara:strand:+ start:271 stop:444 length:174 start_codon:yes stop_codon:yes gene_type:complete
MSKNFEIIDNISKGNLSKARELVKLVLDRKAVEFLEKEKVNTSKDFLKDKSDETGEE